MGWTKRKKRKKKPLNWLAVLNKRKQIMLSMEVARVIDENGIVVDEELLRRHGLNRSSSRWEKVEHLLRFETCSYGTTQAMVKIIAEYAKPFVPGLTKAMAPKMREAYIEAKRKGFINKNNIERELGHSEQTMILLGERNSATTRHKIDYSKHPVHMGMSFYVNYLKKKLRDPEYAHKFVENCVHFIADRSTDPKLRKTSGSKPQDMTPEETLCDLISKTLTMDDEHITKLTKEHGITIFCNLSLLNIAPFQPIRLTKTFEELVRDKARKLGFDHYAPDKQIKLCVRKNEINIIVFT